MCSMKFKVLLVFMTKRETTCNTSLFLSIVKRLSDTLLLGITLYPFVRLLNVLGLLVLIQHSRLHLDRGHAGSSIV